MRVILPGSYDPITLGHLEIIKRASRIYDDVYVVIFVNPCKEYMFTRDERLKMLRLATEGLCNVTVDASDGLVIDYMREHKIDKIVKGYRNNVDLEYEKKQAEYNLKNGGFETELWLAEENFRTVSSTSARECIKKGEATDEFLPKKVISFIDNH